MIIFLAKGHTKLGHTQRNSDGNVVSSTPAQFEVDSNGPCVAVGELDPETMQVKEPISSIYGDWDAAGNLGEVMEHIKPTRPLNIPNMKAIVQAACSNGEDLCDYCNSGCCRDCIIAEWKEERDQN